MDTLNMSFVPAMLGYCHKARRTGILTIKNDFATKSVHFESGNIVFAASSLKEERLGERLVEWGVLSSEALQTASNIVKQFQLRLGRVLVEANYLREEDLKGLITRQVSEIVYSMFSWQSPQSQFEECCLPEYEFKISMPTAQIILEGIRRLDDTELLAKMIADLKAPLCFVDDPHLLYQIVNLKSQETLFISYLDGTSRSTLELMEIGSAPKLVVMRTVAALLQASILTTTTVSQKPLPAPLLVEDDVKSGPFDTKKVMEFCYEVESKVRSVKAGVSPYETLEVNHHASFDELKAAYARLARKFHPSRQAQLNDYHLNLHTELELIFNNLTNAIEVLTNPQSREDCRQETSQLFKRPMSNRQPTILQDNDAEKSVRVQQAAMELCYTMESKLATIKDGGTYYQLLELERDATQQMIEDAYRRLSEQFDVKHQAELTAYGLDLSAQLKELSAGLQKAFEVLSNPYKRQDYDYHLARMLRRDTGAFRVIKESQPNDKPQPETASPTPTTATLKPLASLPKAQPAPSTVTFPSTPNQNHPAPTPQSSSTEATYHKFNEDESAKYRLAKNTPSCGKSKTLSATEFYLRSIELCDNGQYELAAAALRKAVEISPNDGEYWAQLGRVYSQMQNSLNIVERAYREAIRCEPDNADYPTELGLVYQKTGLHRKALEMLQMALEIEPLHLAAQKAFESMPKLEHSGKTGKLRDFLGKLGFR
ncbi:MAG: DUF4388 domain-containing protein [Acidobacteriota bacterium]